MRKTAQSSNNENSIMITVKQLQERLNCGYQTAVHIAEKAEARVYVGRRVFYNVRKINTYVEQIAS